MRVELGERACAALLEQQVKRLQHQRVDLGALDIGDVAQLDTSKNPVVTGGRGLVRLR
jgi:hypothetical protein